jgi:hypothetical protein
MYKENPKTQGSGIYCAIPQTDECPQHCEDCFFQSGRSYLEPLKENLPNMPRVSKDKIVRVNDGHDSFYLTEQQINQLLYDYPNCFFNTSIPVLDKYHHPFEGFYAYSKNTKSEYYPVVLTLNPSKMTDTSWHKIEIIPENLMFVRIRVNTWNINTVVKPAVEYYSSKNVPIILTFMAYYQDQKGLTQIKDLYQFDYEYKKRTLNDYWVITQDEWDRVMNTFKGNKWVYSCGKDANTHACRHCGNCLREYHATLIRLGR